MFEDFKSKSSVKIVYTGNGKGKTSAALGLSVRALGAGWKVAFVQFIKYWEVSEHKFFNEISELYKNEFIFYKGGKGFYDAGEMSAQNVTQDEHKQAANETYEFALACAKSGDYQLVVCDEINNAVSDELITVQNLKDLIKSTNKETSICLTGRNFPEVLLDEVDIATNMTKLKHHFDDKYLANKGIDY